MGGDAAGGHEETGLIEPGVVHCPTCRAVCVRTVDEVGDLTLTLVGARQQLEYIDYLEGWVRQVGGVEDLTQEEKLAELDPELRRKVEHGVLPDLRAHGWEPTIAEAWRSLKVQAQKVRLGYSTTMHSKHCATKDGKPAARAADIVDQRWYWGMPERALRAYRRDIMSTCKAHGLTSGGAWRRLYGVYGDWAHVELPG